MVNYKSGFSQENHLSFFQRASPFLSGKVVVSASDCRVYYRVGNRSALDFQFAHGVGGRMVSEVVMDVPRQRCGL